MPIRSLTSWTKCWVKTKVEHFDIPFSGNGTLIHQKPMCEITYKFWQINSGAIWGVQKQFLFLVVHLPYWYPFRLLQALISIDKGIKQK